MFQSLLIHQDVLVLFPMRLRGKRNVTKPTYEYKRVVVSSKGGSKLKNILTSRQICFDFDTIVSATVRRPLHVITYTKFSRRQIFPTIAECTRMA